MVDPTKAAIIPPSETEKWGYQNQEAWLLLVPQQFEEDPLKGYDEAGSGMPTRLDPETNCFCGGKVLEEKCLKQQANKEDNSPSSSLPLTPPGGRLLTGSNLAKTKPFFAGSQHKEGEGNGTPLQYSCLENPMDGGAW